MHIQDPKLKPMIAKISSLSQNMDVDNRYQSRVAAAVAGTFVLGTLALTLPFIALPTGKKGFLPFMATPGRKVRAALEFIAAKETRPGSSSAKAKSFLDLGSGDGEAVYQAAKVIGGERTPMFAKVVGRELNPTLYLFSLFRRFTWSPGERSRTSFECSDFWKHPVGDFQVILIFGVQPLMIPLSVKLANECQPGTFILSYRFCLPSEDKETTRHGQLARTKVIYEEEEMRIYEVVSR